MLLFYPAGKVMDRYGRMWVAVPAMLLMGLGLIAVPFTSGIVTFALAAALMGLGNGMSSGLVMVLGADASPNVGRASFLGVFRLLADLGLGAGPLLLGGVAAVAGLASGVWFVGGVGLLGAVAMGGGCRARTAHPSRGSSSPSRDLLGPASRCGRRHPSEVLDELLAAGHEDGLPVVPPTAARVDAMLAGVGEPDDVLGLVPPLFEGADRPRRRLARGAGRLPAGGAADRGRGGAGGAGGPLQPAGHRDDDRCARGGGAGARPGTALTSGRAGSAGRRPAWAGRCRWRWPGSGARRRG